MNSWSYMRRALEDRATDHMNEFGWILPGLHAPKLSISITAIHYRSRKYISTRSKPICFVMPTCVAYTVYYETNYYLSTFHIKPLVNILHLLWYLVNYVFYSVLKNKICSLLIVINCCVGRSPLALSDQWRTQGAPPVAASPTKFKKKLENVS